MENMIGLFTIQEILYAAVLSYILTVVILRIVKIYRFLTQKQDISLEYQRMDLSVVLEKCRELFPIDTMYFHGKVFRRGMMVQITTMKNKIIEGELIGKNKVDVVCIRTRRHIVAHEIEDIEDMAVLEEL